VDKRHLDFNYINELKQNSKTDENSLRELLEIQEIGKSSLSEISHEFEIPVKPYIDSLNIYKNNNITNFYCRKIVEEYSNLLKNTDSKKYEKTSMDYFSGFDYSSMSNINEPFNKIIEKKLIKQYYTAIFSNYSVEEFLKEIMKLKN
jgi:division protein CdvB (Snf7/Vps24/ESCRT-III family)